MEPSSAIASDIPCRRCGYNLRGLAESGRCPECRTPVGLSTQGDLLRLADPQWLGKLHVGLWLISANAICLIAMRLQNYVLPIRVPYYVHTFIYLGFALISIAGVWLATAADPVGLYEGQYVTARKVIRITVIVSLAHWAMLGAASVRTMSPDLRRIMNGMIGVFLVVGVVGEVAKFKYFGQLAARIPRPLMRRYALLMMCLAAINGTAGVLIFLMAMFGTFDLSVVRMHSQVTVSILALALIFYVRMAMIIRVERLCALRDYAAAEGAVIA